MKTLAELLNTFKVPLGSALALAVAAVAGFIYIDTRYVLASDFAQFQRSTARRDLERDKRQLEVEIIKLLGKQESGRMTVVDKRLLDKFERDLRATEAELRRVR